MSDILAWGRSNGNDGLDGDPWALYQNRLLPELQAVARKYGGGISPADVATAFHLYRKPVPRLGSSRTDPGTASGTQAFDSAAAVSLPIRVNSAGSVSARRAAEADEDRVAGRRGAELADALDPEDIQRIAAAVGAGNEREAIEVGGALRWEDEQLLGGAEGEEEGALWAEQGVGLEGPTIFL